MAIISVNDVSLGYGGNTVAEHINFELEAGKYLCIVGENGSGKSTLLKALLGLHPVQSGKILFGEGLRASDIGYLPQKTETQQDFPACVREVVMSGCLASKKFRPFYTKSDKARAKWAMEQMEIAEFSGKCYRALSGGQQQRVLLARALCAAKKLIVLDEPISGLDPQMASRMYCLIDKLSYENGLAVIMISHNRQAVRHADYILDMEKSGPNFLNYMEFMSSERGRRFMQKEGDR